VQIDSHTIFVKNWDIDLIGMMKRLPNNAVITHYPQPINIKTLETEINRKDTVPIICGAEYKNNVITFKGKEVHKKELKPNEPNYNVGSAAGFLCMHGRAVQQVPYDPKLDMLFTGEEILYSARLFTHGYDFYPPTKNIVFHYYTRKDEPKFWDDIKHTPRHNGKQVVQGLLENNSEYTKSYYGLGNTRSIDDYWELLSYDKTRKTFFKNTCGF
jgi:hypothetical protein